MFSVFSVLNCAGQSVQFITLIQCYPAGLKFKYIYFVYHSRLFLQKSTISLIRAQIFITNHFSLFKISILKSALFSVRLVNKTAVNSFSVKTMHSKTDVWLTGQHENELPGNVLPTTGKVLKTFLYSHKILKNCS